MNRCFLVRKSSHFQHRNFTVDWYFFLVLSGEVCRDEFYVFGGSDLHSMQTGTI